MNKIYKHIGYNRVMFFENNNIEIFGRKLGFITGYLLLTIMLFIMLKIFNRIPDSWTLFHISIITIIITLIGYTINRILK